MPRVLSAGFTAALSAPVTVPGYLVEINFATPFRMCSRATITWNGLTWSRWGVELRGIVTDGAQSAISGSLLMENTDNTLGTLILGEGVADRAIKIWQIYGETPNVIDALFLMQGVGDSASIDINAGTVEVSIMQSGGATLYTPRRYITREEGFQAIPANGTVVQWAGESYVLEGDRNG